MFYTLIAIVTLVATIAMLVDLKIDRWEWTDRQRKTFAAIDAVICIWATGQSPSIWLRVIVAIAMIVGVFLLYKFWDKRRRQGGNFTSFETIIGLGLCIVAGWVFYSMVSQLILRGVFRGGM